MANNPQNPFVSEFGELSSGILLNIAEILTLRLPEGRERVIASKWTKKFLACNPADYKNNLSLFISSLTKQVLVKPFDVPPEDQSDQWKPFDKEYKPIDIHRGVKQRLLKDAYAPPYKVEISQDMHEYTAFQEIPFFGAHFYYAFSVDERLDKWHNFDKLKVPKSYVKALQLGDQIEESPIKRCKFPKQSLAYATQGKPRAGASKIKKPSAKPGWEGPIEEEEEVAPAPENPTAVTFSTDVAPGNIPAKLQQRFIEAARQKEERLQAIEEKIKKGVTPAVGPKGQQKRKIAKKVLKRVTPDLGTSKGQTPMLPEESQRAGTKESSRQALFEEGEQQEGPGEEVRVMTQIESFREFIDSLKKQLPDQVKQTSDALKNEMDRTKREKTPNTPAVDEIQEQEIEIGTEIADILSEQVRLNRYERMREANKTDDPDLMNLSVDFRFVDEQRAGRPGVFVRPETLKRLTELRDIAEQSLHKSMGIQPKQLFGGLNLDESLNEFEQLEVEAAAENMLDILDNAVQVATEANEKLEELVPQSNADVQLVSELIQSNNLIIEEAAPNVKNLIAALEQMNNQLPRVVMRAAEKLNESIEKSNEIDQNAVEATPESPVAAQASIIQDQRNVFLQEAAQDAAEISRIGEETQKPEAWQEDYQPADVSVRQHMAIHRDDDVIDLTQVDTELGGSDVDITDFLNATKNTKQRRIHEASGQFHEIAGNLDEEQLDDINVSFEKLVNPSFEELVIETRNVVEQLKSEVQQDYENAIQNLSPERRRNFEEQNKMYDEFLEEFRAENVPLQQNLENVPENSNPEMGPGTDEILEAIDVFLVDLPLDESLNSGGGRSPQRHH